MKPKTQKQLFNINKNFYKEQGETFDSTRQKPWDGWLKLHAYLKKYSPKTVLDIGCGNGRFANFLNKNHLIDQDFQYLGIDNSSELLSVASKLDLSEDNFEFQNFDLQTLDSKKSFNKKFDLIVIFGVMHHIPSYSNRLNLLNFAKSNLAKKGLLIISFWQFANDQKFTKKIIPWSEVGEIDKNDLEKDDYLLGWQKSNSLRYCHHSSDQEINQLIIDSNLNKVDEYLEDGKSHTLNKYIILSYF